jgi:catechol 2,3-dioxygenase-like lactoylglutathione lyase family enzyme
VTIVVKDQDEALEFYTEVLGMERVTDITRAGQRFVTVTPAGQKSVEIILAKADWYGTGELVGKGTTWVIDTNDFRKTHAALVERGVKFIREPEKAPHGMQAVFFDLYGNPFALIERPARRQ